MPIKKIPPFGRALFALQQKGYCPRNTINLWIGQHAWDKGKIFSRMMPRRTLILPPWLAPEKFHWPVKEADVLIHDTGYAEQDYLDDLARVLYQDGADIVRCLTPDLILQIFEK